ncbi:pyridoxamine 5'-phosphate oxidase family protein [Salinifilum ghardaiensis]
MLTEHQRALVRGANPAVISTITPEGRSMTLPTWHLLDGDDLLLSIDAENPRGDRLAHLRNEPRFTLTVMERADWTRSVTLFATAIEMFADHDLRLVDSMARVHGHPRFQRRSPRTAVRARIDDVLTANIAPPGTSS